MAGQGTVQFSTVLVQCTWSTAWSRVRPGRTRASCAMLRCRLHPTLGSTPWLHNIISWLHTAEQGAIGRKSFTCTASHHGYTQESKGHSGRTAFTADSHKHSTIPGSKGQRAGLITLDCAGTSQVASRACSKNRCNDCRDGQGTEHLVHQLLCQPWEK